VRQHPARIAVCGLCSRGHCDEHYIEFLEDEVERLTGELTRAYEELKGAREALTEEYAVEESLRAEVDRLRAALEECKHFLLQMKQESLGPLFGMANYKHEADRLFDIARNALAEEVIAEDISPR